MDLRQLLSQIFSKQEEEPNQQVEQKTANVLERLLGNVADPKKVVTELLESGEFRKFVKGKGVDPEVVSRIKHQILANCGLITTANEITTKGLGSEEIRSALEKELKQWRIENTMTGELKIRGTSENQMYTYYPNKVEETVRRVKEHYVECIKTSYSYSNGIMIGIVKESGSEFVYDYLPSMEDWHLDLTTVASIQRMGSRAVVVANGQEFNIECNDKSLPDPEQGYEIMQDQQAEPAMKEQ